MGTVTQQSEANTPQGMRYQHELSKAEGLRTHNTHHTHHTQHTHRTQHTHHTHHTQHRSNVQLGELAEFAEGLDTSSELVGAKVPVCELGTDSN